MKSGTKEDIRNKIVVIIWNMQNNVSIILLVNNKYIFPCFEISETSFELL